MTDVYWKDLTSASPGVAGDRKPLDVRSAISVPLQSPGGTHGALTMILSSRDRRSFDADDLAFAEELGRQAGTAIANAQLYAQEHRVATRLQSASLPAILPAPDRLCFDAVYAPGNQEAEIGGDWYDALTLPDGRIVLTVGDVLGNGLEAAVRMGRLRQSMRTAAVLDPDPAAILRAADVMSRLDDPDGLATALAAIVDTAAMTMRFASAGHPPPMLVAADGVVTEIAAEAGLPLGLRDGTGSAVREIQLARDMMVVFYTDGLTEATRDMAEGERRLEAALADPTRQRNTGKRDQGCRADRRVARRCRDSHVHGRAVAARSPDCLPVLALDRSAQLERKVRKRQRLGVLGRIADRFRDVQYFRARELRDRGERRVIALIRQQRTDPREAPFQRRVPVR